jgi:hypothetical protein
MKRFVEGTDRGQSTLFPECLDDWIDEDNPVRVASSSSSTARRKPCDSFIAAMPNSALSGC